MKRLLLSYAAFFPVIFISRLLLIGLGREFDFVEDLVFSIKWTLFLAFSFLVMDLLGSFSFSERKFNFKKSKKAIIIIGSIILIGGFVLPRIDAFSILIMLIVLVITDLIRNKIVFGKFLKTS